MKLLWSRRAQRQLNEAIVYLEEQRMSAGAGLYDAIRETSELIQRHPYASPRVPNVEGHVRRALIGRYRYWLIYEITSDAATAVVLALWNTRRRPSGWMRSR